MFLQEQSQKYLLCNVSCNDRNIWYVLVVLELGVLLLGEGILLLEICDLTEMFPKMKFLHG